MTPIINPWIFYFAEIFNNIHLVFGVLSIVFLIVVIVLTITTAVMSVDDFGLYDHEIEVSKTYLKIFVILLLISSPFAILSPSKETVYKMTIASYITEENYVKGKEEVKEIIDYIAEKIDDAEGE